MCLRASCSHFPCLKGVIILGTMAVQRFSLVPLGWTTIPRSPASIQKRLLAILGTGHMRQNVQTQFFSFFGGNWPAPFFRFFTLECAREEEMFVWSVCERQGRGYVWIAWSVCVLRPWPIIIISLAASGYGCHIGNSTSIVFKWWYVQEGQRRKGWHHRPDPAPFLNGVRRKQGWHMDGANLVFSPVLLHYPNLAV